MLAWLRIFLGIHDEKARERRKDGELRSSVDGDAASSSTLAGGRTAPAGLNKVKEVRSGRASKEPTIRTLAETLGCNEAEVAMRADLAGTTPPDWQRVQAGLQELKQIPALKSLARKFALSLDRQVVSIPEVVASLGHDPALCMRILRMANSVFVSAREPISDLNVAVQMLGVDRVRLIANVLLLQRDSQGIASGFDWKHLWMHSLATAMLAERLDVWSGRHAGPSLPVCAILHDVGKIALSVVAPDFYQGILLTAWRDQVALHPLELTQLGMDHREAGWVFGSEAGLSTVVLDTIAYHDEPLRAHPEHRGIVALVAVANQWAKMYGLGFSGDGTRLTEDIWETPAWALWVETLPVAPSVDVFASREAAWVEEVRRELMSFHE